MAGGFSMTALAGLWKFGTGIDPHDACALMLDAQSAYGRSPNSILTDRDLALGRRLFPLLPEDKHDTCPLRSAANQGMLVADLRLDNREELATSLHLGKPAYLCSDADILLGALERWGEQTPEHLVGDFAFAYYDRAANRLILARDPLGQRPLFWHRSRDFFAFASMPSGLRALKQISAPVDEQALARFLALLPRSPEESYFRTIQRVRPGHVLVATPGGQSSRRYWEPRRRSLQLGSFEDHVDAFRHTLDRAVADRLRGQDGIVATHLSGGWDSSAVTATAARVIGPAGKILAFTSVPDPHGPVQQLQNRFSDEGPAAAETARLYANVEHVRIPADGLSPVEDLDRYLHAFQRPPFNLINHRWLAQIRSAAADRGAHILLTGEIGNWTISAAPPTLLADFIHNGQWLAWARETSGMLSQGRARLRGVLANSFGPWMPSPIWRAFRGLSSAARVRHNSAIHPDLMAALAQEQDEYELGSAGRPKDNFERTAAALMEMDFGEYRKGILGGWGIDKRDATADMRLVEFCLSLPPEMLMKDGVRRPLASAALADRLPATILQEKKKGYQAAGWHREMTRDLPAISALIDRMAANDIAAGLIDIPALRQWVRDWPSGDLNDPIIMARYRNALPQALAVGAFVLAER